MGKLDSFAIVLDKSIYLAGECISGTLVVKIKERLKLNGIKLEALGEGRVSLMESVRRNNETHYKYHNAYEKYLSYSINILRRETLNDFYLEIGEYSYPFQFTLSKNLPTSFEHHLGRVRYSLKGTIDIPWAFDKHVIKNVTVISAVDLNSSPTARQPYNVSENHHLCCWCCRSEPIKTSISILKSGYVCGEFIQFKATIENKSDRSISGVKVKLKQKTVFLANSKSRACFSDAAVVEFDKTVNERSTEEWNGSLKVPAVCPSSTTNLILISYSLDFEVDPKGPNIDMTISIPVVIGTLPLRDIKDPIPEPNYYQTILKRENSMAVEDTKGDMIRMDDRFEPSYPYYRRSSES